MSDMVRLARVLLRQRGTIALAVVAAILSSLFLGGAVSMLKPLTEGLLTGSSEVRSSPAAAEPATLEQRTRPALIEWFERLQDRLWAPVRAWLLERGWVRVPAAMVLLFLLKGIFGFVAVYGFRRAGLNAIVELRQLVYGRAVGQSDAFYRDHGTAEMLSRILGDTSRLQAVLGGEFSQALQSIPIVIVLVGVAFAHSWQMTAATLVVVPLFAAAAGRLGRRVKKASRRVQERAARLAALIEETLHARRVVQAFDGVGHETRRFRREVLAMNRQDLKVARHTAATGPVMELIGAVAGAALIVYAGTLLRAGTAQGEDVLVAVVALFYTFSHVRRLSHLNNAVQQAMAAAERVFRIVDEPIRIADDPRAVAVDRFDRALRLESVTFNYGRGPVLRGVDLVVPKGSVHALVGPSGSGKTTLAMLIPRFMDPTTGAVYLDDRDLREIRLSFLRRLIALVTQETHLFDDTVFANIAYARADASEDEIRAAAEAAQADRFIRELPDGYRTRLGERGSRLSAGQRQRLAIARAFLKDAPILILDEATSALDTESEHLVQQALERLLEGRTALIIAHRLSTVRQADRIHVLQAGGIVESGRHEELLSASGAYARLHALQSGAAALERPGS
jgi:subfamily B ATP-binding cassette protein MsbA